MHKRVFDCKGLMAVIFVLAAALILPAQRSLAQPLDQAIQQSFGAGQLPGLHSAIIDIADERLAEVYFSDEDEIWGTSLGLRTHGPDTLHDLRSVTKSVVGLLYGIALAEGAVPETDMPLYAQFPQYPDLLAEPGRDRILVEHALSMQMGTKWSEDLPYTDPRNSEIAMGRAADRYRYVLEQPIQEKPGRTWIYSGGAVALLGKLIEAGSGLPIDVYAKERLFDPLGIDRFEWMRGVDGVPSAASGLRLTLPDLAKIGRLVAQDGTFGGKRIVPADWLARSTRPRANLSEGFGYGYLWYLAGSEQNQVVIAVGNGGQRLTVQPRHGLVVASFAGLYNEPNSWKTSLRIVSNFAVPEAKRRLAR